MPKKVDSPQRIEENREVSWDKTSFPGRNFLSRRRTQQSAKEARYPAAS